MGPFELIDYTGLDINLHVANTFFDEFRDPAWAPPPLLKRMVLAGHLGVKTGKGFYEYDENGKRKAIDSRGARSGAARSLTGHDHRRSRRRGHLESRALGSDRRVATSSALAFGPAFYPTGSSS